MSLKELMEALKKGRKYIQLKNGEWAKISEAFEARLKNIREMLDEDEGELHADPSAMEGIEEAESQEVLAIKSSEEWWGLKRKLENTKSIDESIPEGLQAQLRPYQVQGYKWLNRLVTWELGACLADDMGLGKTLQTLAVLLKHGQKGPSLVVAPLSVVSNWQKEMQRFCPRLRPIIYRDSHRLSLLKRLMPYDVLITSYGLVWRDLEELQKELEPYRHG